MMNVFHSRVIMVLEGNQITLWRNEKHDQCQTSTTFSSSNYFYVNSHESICWYIEKTVEKVFFFFFFFFHTRQVNRLIFPLLQKTHKWTWVTLIFTWFICHSKESHESPFHVVNGSYVTDFFFSFSFSSLFLLLLSSFFFFSSYFMLFFFLLTPFTSNFTTPTVVTKCRTSHLVNAILAWPQNDFLLRWPLNKSL